MVQHRVVRRIDLLAATTSPRRRQTPRPTLPTYDRRSVVVVVGSRRTSDPETGLGERVTTQQAVRAAAALGACHVLGEVIGEAKVGDGVQDRHLIRVSSLVLPRRCTLWSLLLEFDDADTNTCCYLGVVLTFRHRVM